MLERFEIQTISEDAVIGAFTLREPAFVRAVARSSGDEIVYESIERERIGRIFLEDLKPDTDYAVTFSAEGNELATTRVRTLPRPQGPKLAEFVVMADPHLTTCRETRRGRLFFEAEASVRHAIAQINQQNVDFVLMPGDITNQGRADECVLARRVLDELQSPLLLVGGDHDTQLHYPYFRENFGAGLWAQDMAGFTFIGCEGICYDGKSSDYRLGEEGINHILRALESTDRPVILISHRELIPDDYIPEDNRLYSDYELFAQRVLSRLPVGTLAYIGHKNLPVMCRAGNLTQLNCPQLVQYPCGILRVRCYENGMYHSFEPMFSEILNDFSRVTGNALGDPLWEENYRRGRGPHLWNFVWDTVAGAVRS